MDQLPVPIRGFSPSPEAPKCRIFAGSKASEEHEFSAAGFWPTDPSASDGSIHTAGTAKSLTLILVEKCRACEPMTAAAIWHSVAEACSIG